MSKTYSGREIDSALVKKGFRREIDGDHIHYCLMSRAGKKSTIRTKISHGMMGDSLSADLTAKMARQLHLTKRQFLDFVDCHLSEDHYRKILNTKGFPL
jgi:hypothetical protein